MVLSLRESWDLTNSKTLTLLDKIPEHFLSVKSSQGGRSVGAQFSHINSVRVQWLQAISNPPCTGLISLQKDDYTYKTKISEAIKTSSDKFGELIEQSIRSDMRVKGFPKGINAFLLYLVSHEAHHRGQIIYTLKISGLALDKEFLFSLWEF
jgi:uncharacterized damage-inducible protein DinB